MRQVWLHSKPEVSPGYIANWRLSWVIEQDLVSTKQNPILMHKQLSEIRNTSWPWSSRNLAKLSPQQLPSHSHHTDADELDVGMVRTEGIGGRACEEGIVLGCRHIGNGQEATVDNTLVVPVLCVPEERARSDSERKTRQGWTARAGARPGYTQVHLGSWRSRGTPFLVQVKSMLGTPRARQWRVAELVLSPAAATFVKGVG